MADIAIYTFDSGRNVLPTFNNDFVYNYTDIDNGDGTITRTITSNDTPTSISFMNTSVKTVEYLNITNKITSLESLFAQCYSLTSFNASNWDTSEVTSMQWMCYRAGNLKTIDLSGLNTSKLTNMINMFYECNRAVEYNLSGWDVSKVTDMMQVFYSADNAHTINIDGWKLNPNMTIDQYMFSISNVLSVISLKNSTAETINRLIPYLPNCNIEGGRLVIIGVDDIDSVDIAAIETKGWTVQSFELNLTNKFVDGDKLNKFAKLIKTNIINTTKKYVDDRFDIQNFLMPDDFEGTDGEKLQACFDALKDTGGFITINREYVLDRDIVIKQDSNLNLQTTVKGIGEVSKINCGPYCFKGKEGEKHSWGGIKFSDLQITGTETMMQCANLIRVICSSCLISDFKYVCYSPDYTQSMYFIECVIRNISESVMFTETPESTDAGNDGTLFDTRICFCLIEWCNHLLNSFSYYGCTIDNNCIEGFTNVPLIFNGKTRGVAIKNNYFEANEGGAIDLTGSSNQYSQSITIDSNVFVTSDNASVTILLPVNRVIGSITISNNSTSSYATPLYIVPASAKNYSGIYIYNNYGNTSGNTNIIDSNITKLDYANSVSNVLKGSVIDINNGVEARNLTNVRYFGKTTQDGVPSANSPFVPVSLLNKQNFRTYITTSKNILEITATTATVNGITFTVTSEKIQLSGTTTADDVIFNINYEQGKLNVPVGTWRMSGPTSSNMYIQLYVDGQLAGQTKNTETLVTVPEGATESYVRIKVNGTTGTSLNGHNVFPMLVSSDDKDSSSTFEKFTKEFFSIAMSNFSHGLHGVPVTSGGNYTDSTGQQWLADCIDVAKGTIDRRFKEITLNGTETWTVQTYSNQPAGMYCYRLALDNKRIGEGLSRCSHFQNVKKCWEFKQGLYTFSDHSGSRYSFFITDIATIEEWKSWLAANNVKFVYATTNTESEQLSEHNRSQFSVIAVTKSHCRITNDKNCEMEVTYVVDTKAYIETALDEKADKNDLFSKDYNDLTNKPEIPSIEGLATEEYVDNTYLPLTGGLVTGNVQIDGNLVNNNNATFNKQVTFNDIATLGAGANLAGNEVQINADALVNNAVSTHNQAATFNEDVIFNKNVTFGEDAVLSGNKVQIDANTLVNNAVSTHNQAATFNGDVTINSPTTLGAGANLAGNEVQINANTLVNNAVSTHNQAATFNGETTFNSPTTLGAGANLAGNEVQINANTLVNNAVSTHNQAATFNNTVTFNEQATFSKDLNVAGNVNVTAETGDAWFNGNVSVGADNKQLATEEFVNTMLDGLRLMQITREDYDALETKDPSTLYIII